MPRRQRELTPAVSLPSKSLVASATRYSGKTARIYNNDRQEWQAEAYRHYQICGEARFAAQFFGHALSKASLYVPKDPHDARSPRVEEGPAYDALEQLFNGSEGQAAMLSAIGIHFTIAGECYLIGRKAPDMEDTDLWEIRSVLEVTCTGTGDNATWTINNGGGQAPITLTTEDVVIRLWIPDPAHAMLADSPFKSILPILEEIEWLTRYIFAQCSSRLAGAGVWLIDEAVDFPPPPDDPNGTGVERTKADNLMRLLADNMLKPIQDPGSPAAKVPIVMTMPGDSIGKQQWINFWSELDTEAKGLRQEAIQRFALGMDLPPERILGMSAGAGAGGQGGGARGISHWGAWQIDEDTIKMHVEPMLDIVCSGIAISYIRPVSGIDDAVLRYDTASLRLRPDRSQEALELYDRGLIKAEVAVRENGFDPAEMMTDEERQTWLTIKVASGSATPEMVSEALAILGVDLPTPPTSVMPYPSEMPNESRPVPSLEDHPTRDLPERAALLAAADALTYRALERAGNRLRSDGVKPPVPSYETHTMMTITAQQAHHALTDAWACAEPVLDGICDPKKIVPILNAYAASLLLTGKPHTRDALAKWLDKAERE